jgi:hypothetical protein
VRKRPTVVRQDVDAILAVLFDIHRGLIRIRRAVEEEDEDDEAEED